MADVVTLAEAKAFLRVEGDWEDATILTLIGAATEAVLAHADAYLGLDPVPNRIKAAVLARVAILFDQRDTVEAPAGEAGLLSPLRRLSL